jgi:acyl-[acyl-carrier-protein]-phospholipid O-acyltransferase/long-chain-fatty-acid--[acyl-carrier-protein] ligase
MSTFHPDRPEGYELPLAGSLTQPILMAGLPREYAILMGTLALVLGLANAIASIFVARLLTQELAGSIARLLFRLFYRVEVKGMENFRAAGRKAVIVANHSSYLDGPLLSAFLPERASFAINSHVGKKWWAKPAFALFNMIPIDPANPMALRALVDELKQGRKVVIFPEGRLTVTGKGKPPGTFNLLNPST